MDTVRDLIRQTHGLQARKVPHSSADLLLACLVEFSHFMQTYHRRADELMRLLKHVLVCFSLLQGAGKTPNVDQPIWEGNVTRETSEASQGFRRDAGQQCIQRR